MGSYGNFVLLLLSLHVITKEVSALNILGVFPYEGKSHFFVFKPYLEELARRGHNLTVISYFPQEKPLKNYKDISLAGKSKILEGAFPLDVTYLSTVIISFILAKSGTDNCRILLGDENVQQLWKNKAKFDVVLVEQFNSDCSLGLAYKLGAPVVGLTSHSFMPWHYDRFGVSFNPSYASIIFYNPAPHPTLYHRVETSIFHMYYTLVYKYYGQRSDQQTLAQYFDDIPPLNDLAHQMNMLLMYTHPLLNGRSMLPPKVVEVGGYHVAEPKKLPENILKFIEESKHGVIYISFGSMLQASSTPKPIQEAIIAAVSELPQRTIWKWDEPTLPGNPKDIFISNWLPQNDLLAHPKVLAFYSHCGLLGTTEAMHHGVPMVGMPIFGDQPGNAQNMAESGLGVQLHLKELTKEKLLEKFKTVLDPEFRANVKKLSKAWHDRPRSAMDTAIFWTEYTARNGNFSLSSPVNNVPWYQLLCIDVIFIVTSFILASFYVSISLVKFLLKLYKKKTKKD